LKPSVNLNTSLQHTLRWLSVVVGDGRSWLLLGMDSSRYTG